MKKLIYLFIIALVFSACGSKNDTPAPATPKNISRALIGPELPVQQKTSAFYVGVRYFKDYAADDQVTLSFNGQNGVIQNSYKTEIEGSNVLFLFQPTGQAVTGKLKLSIKNDQSTFEQEQNFRVTEDLNLKTVWNALDKTYRSEVANQIKRFTTGSSFGFDLLPSTGVLGLYTDDPSFLINQYGKTLIPGLKGTYEPSYTGEVLSEMKVTQDYPQVNPTFSAQKIYTDMAAVYGNPVSRVQQNGVEITTYGTSEFSLTTYLNPTAMYTIVRRK
ncbi:MAG: hypothetical protein EOP45_15010 [Sphingobacteriaceae bacterium]|nr:MAG: hypothetical protein EOP45_15010 [Sphingobacteriaceae bacterium]